MALAPISIVEHDDDEIVTSSPRDPRARPLLDALVGEYSRRYHDLEGRPVDAAAQEVYHRYAAEAFESPHGSFILILRGGVPIAGGGFMRHADEGTAEVKRMWTADTHRRQGLARRVLTALEDRARALGYTRIYLTTGFRQPEAAALYHRSGYTGLYDPAADLAARFTLPFEKYIGAPLAAERRA
ncbi:GNAT family N-acetyltransferase [Sphingomonas sp. TX0543]|uniref:GNAT family N-acetyltransferase n=1 Tax=unclassified Sphingomonas TaxID=196159 RepID=UPI0010F4BC7D|nr:GNAT family N-acetyltransferase [Sphingomonas sp. 3P27F8]